VSAASAIEHRFIRELFCGESESADEKSDRSAYRISYAVPST
jgi:hypothetical protein